MSCLADFSRASPCADAGALLYYSFAVGGKLATKLDSVLRKLTVDLAAVPDSWNAPMQILGKERGLRVELVRLRARPPWSGG